MATAARFLGSVGLSFVALVPFAALVVLVALPLTGCTQGMGTAGDAPPPASAARGAVIAQLVTHDAKIAILSGGGDLRVVVRTMDGAIVADGITLDELRVRQPDLYEVVTSAFASADGQHGYIDATLDLGHMN